MPISTDVGSSPTSTGRTGTPDADRSNPRLRRRPRPATTLLLPLTLFLAAGWLRAGVEKVIDPRWWTGAHLHDFLDEQRPLMLPWFRVFADAVVDPLAPAVAWLVLVAQLSIALCLVINRRVKAALWLGIVLNVSFTMAGRVNPSAFYLVMQLALLFALSRPVTTRIAVRRAVLWLVPAALVLPFARTLHPAHVIDDPALMLSFTAVLAAVTTVALSVDIEPRIDLMRARVRQESARVRARLVKRRHAGGPVEAIGRTRESATSG